MALNCGFCGTEIKDGYAACSACGEVLRRRPPLIASGNQTSLVAVCVERDLSDWA